MPKPNESTESIKPIDANLASAPISRRRFGLFATSAWASFVGTAAIAQMPGRPPGGAPPSGRQHGGGEMPRCPPESAALLNTAVLSSEQIRRHFEALKVELKLTDATVAVFDAYADNARRFLEDEERLRNGVRAVSQSGVARMTRMLDDARNRYTAVEDLQEQANKLMALLNAPQRTLADPKLLPMPTQTPRKAI